MVDVNTGLPVNKQLQRTFGKTQVAGTPDLRCDPGLFSLSSLRMLLPLQDCELCLW